MLRANFAIQSMKSFSTTLTEQITATIYVFEKVFQCIVIDNIAIYVSMLPTLIIGCMEYILPSFIDLLNSFWPILFRN